ncbi:uncharacterized protein DEA37_0002745 [Paragonimus westermani]|uniref:Uncharacterized protein n=1 Tax=Paragonimus westermani TaxID=34504 RepID=A0A5J4NRT3_9TREM|nr:uncharacterized protein DEA37_0002745 [Paragonimus westermani]
MITQLCTCLVVAMLTEIDCVVELITRDLDAGLIANSKLDFCNQFLLGFFFFVNYIPVFQLFRLICSFQTTSEKCNSKSLTGTSRVCLMFQSRFNRNIVQAYEQQLIERVGTGRYGYRIALAIDYEPTPRRLSRIQAILERNGTLVIPHESPSWRFRFPELLRRFSDSGGAFIKLGEILSTARANRLMRLRLQDNGSDLFQISRMVVSIDEVYRTR